MTSYAYFPDLSLESRSAGGRLEEFTWNALGQMRTAKASEAGNLLNTLTFGYDGLNRLASEAQPGGTVGYSYDSDGNVTSMTYPSGGSVSTPHDPLNRLQSVTLGSDLLASYDRMGFSRVESRTTGTNSGTHVQSATWDGYKRLAGLAAGAALSLGYGHDDLGRRTYKDYGG